jgi:hypothetical protein
MQNKIKIPAINIAVDTFLNNKDWKTPLRKILPFLSIIVFFIPFSVKGYNFITY